MTQFQYRARTVSGELTSGAIAAASQAEAGRMLREEGKFVVELETAEDSSAPAGQSAAPSRGRIKREHVIAFTHQLAVMVETGVPISETLRCATDMAESEALRDVIEDVRQHVEAGGELAAGLEKHPKVFPRVMTAMVRASEASGTLGSMLDKSERIEKLVNRLIPMLGLQEDEALYARRAAHLAKADLVTQMVTEMTSLQGIIGREYALRSGEQQEVAEAIGEQYQTVPETKAGLAVALADRLVSLVGLFAAGLAPGQRTHSGCAAPR